MPVRKGRAGLSTFDVEATFEGGGEVFKGPVKYNLSPEYLQATRRAGRPLIVLTSQT